MALTEHFDDASEITLGGKKIINHYIKNLTHTVMARGSKSSAGKMYTVYFNGSMSHGGAHSNTNCSKSLILGGGIHVTQPKSVQTATRAACGPALDLSSPSSHKHAQLHAPAQPVPREGNAHGIPAASGISRSRDSSPSTQTGATSSSGAAPPGTKNAGTPLQVLPSTQDDVKPSHHTAAVNQALEADLPSAMHVWDIHYTSQP